MLAMNKKMNNEMRTLKLDGKKLPAELCKIIESGFFIREDRIFLTALIRAR
jgi:hypothetical protein